MTKGEVEEMGWPLGKSFLCFFHPFVRVKMPDCILTETVHPGQTPQ